ncbi:MAG: HD domain-containing protein [Armatimonadetes bacterium]|nr:HD domain-containing protein [Armatimonadota bacterium]
MSETSSLAAETRISDFIANNPLFYSLAPSVVESIAERFQLRVFCPEERIVKEGDIGDSFYLIRGGHVRVVKFQDDEELVLSELGPGEGFGEMALLIDQPRSATVKAIDDVEALVLMRDDFAVLTRKIPELAEKMNKLLSERVSLLETEDSNEDTRGKFRASRSITLDYSYLDLLMRLNEAAGGHEQVEHCKECGMLAKEMSKMLCPMVSEEILFAGYLHEIGKVSLAGELVKRERAGEPLTEEEQEKVARIFDYAVEILEPNQNLHDSVEFIRYLGRSSYQQMPLEAQILKVADDYLMLRSPGYRDLGDAEGLEIVQQGSGKLYNPRVVAALEKNVRKYKDLRVEGQLNVMRMMVIALDRKDNYTYRHSMDVRDMGMKIVSRLGLGRKDQEYMRIGAELHDVGKIFIDESILNAPRKLTPEEFEIMKGHAAASADFFKDIPGMDELVSIVRAHHEKWNGTGYPDGLAGENIPFLGRVMTIADVWSALTTQRVYRTNAFSPQKALGIMEEMAEGHFDPNVFPIFREIIQEMVAAGAETARQDGSQP